MARSRTLHPAFFTNDAIHSAEVASGLPLRVAYAGLWCHADREGWFEWHPSRLKLGILPFDACDFAAVLDALKAAQFIEQVEFAGKLYGRIPTFRDHQKPHPREAPSKVPAGLRRTLGAPRSGLGNAKALSSRTKSAGLSRPSDSQDLRTLKPSDSQASCSPSASLDAAEAFERAWACYPKRPNNAKAKAERAWQTRIAEGVDPVAMCDGVRAYADYVARTDTPARFVKLASTFFGPDRHWETDYGTPEGEPVTVYDERGEMTPAAARAMGLVT